MPAANRHALERTPAFVALLENYQENGWPKVQEDILWLEGRLQNAPALMGDQVPGLKNLPLPIFKARCKDRSLNIGSSGGWRVYYAIRKEPPKVFMLFFHHKREYENPGLKFLLQKIERALKRNPPQGL